MSLQWLSLVAIIWLQSINGTNSNFPSYSSDLKQILSISQLQLNNLAFASDAGKLLGWISGLAAARLPLWLVLLIGSLLGFFSYGFQFLLITHNPPSYWQFFLLTILAGNSVCWINTVCYIIAIRNFPFDRQIAVGISTSYAGLSAKIYTDVVGVISPAKNTTAESFLLLNSLLPILVFILVAPLTRDADIGKSKKLTGGFVILFTITVITGLFAVTTSLISSASPLVVIIGMAALLWAPLAAPLVESVAENVQQKCWIVAYEEGFDFGGKDEGGRIEDDEIGPGRMVRRVEFWLYFCVYLFGATLGLVYLNNLGQIGESRGCSRVSALVSLASAFGFFGRLLPSLLDYFFSKTNSAVSRATAMGMMTSPMCVAFFWLVISKHESSLYISTAIIGICTGAITSISVSTTTELFGTKNFGVNHNILVSNIPIGSFLFGDFAALLYNKGRVIGEDNCLGERCYQTTFLIWGCLCVLGTLIALVFHARTKKLNIV